MGLRLPIPPLLPPPAPHPSNNISQTRRSRGKNNNLQKKTQKGHRMLCGLSVLGMTCILVPVQVSKASITHNSLHKIPWLLPLQIFWSFSLSLRNKTVNATAVNHGRLPQGYARSEPETQGSVSEVLMVGWVANANGESLKFPSCSLRKIRAKRRHKFELEKSE